MNKNPYLKLALLLLAFIIGLPAQAQHTAQTHQPQTFLNTIRGKPDEGAQIIQQFCVTCHASKPLINLGAPRIGTPSDWTFRLQQGFEILFQHTAEGYHAMPARGGCFECDDIQLRKAIIAILPAKKDNNKNKKIK